MTQISLDTINKADKAAFMAALGDVFEHAPWVADAALAARPFPTLASLYAIMTAAVRAADAAQRLALIKSHPDLAGKAARAGALTSDSSAEQASARLDRLSKTELTKFNQLNEAYRAEIRHSLHHLRAPAQQGLRSCGNSSGVRTTTAPPSSTPL